MKKLTIEISDIDENMDNEDQDAYQATVTVEGEDPEYWCFKTKKEAFSEIGSFLAGLRMAQRL